MRLRATSGENRNSFSAEAKRSQAAPAAPGGARPGAICHGGAFRFLHPSHVSRISISYRGEGLRGGCGGRRRVMWYRVRNGAFTTACRTRPPPSAPPPPTPAPTRVPTVYSLSSPGARSGKSDALQRQVALPDAPRRSVGRTGSGWGRGGDAAEGRVRGTACPLSTGGGTRRVQLVRQGGGGGGRRAEKKGARTLQTPETISVFLMNPCGAARQAPAAAHEAAPGPAAHARVGTVGGCVRGDVGGRGRRRERDVRPNCTGWGRDMRPNWSRRGGGGGPGPTAGYPAARRPGGRPTRT